MFETFQLSNDAFYYLKNGEEPLVDEALDEALVIEALYPDGYTILDFKPLGNTGYIEARIGPNLITAPRLEVSYFIEFSNAGVIRTPLTVLI